MTSLSRRLLKMESMTTAIFSDSTLPYELGIGIPLICFIAGTVNFPKTWLSLLVICFILFSIGRMKLTGILLNFIDIMQETHTGQRSAFLLLYMKCLNGLLIITCWNFLLSILAYWPS